LGRTLAREAGGGHRPVLDRPYRFARDAVEHVDKGLLTDLGYGLDALPSDRDVDQVRRGRRVVVPQPVPDELVVPDLLARCRLDADETVTIEAVTGAMSTVVVVGGCADRQIDIAEFLVGTHGCPDVGVPVSFQESFSQVSTAGSPACGMVLNVHSWRPVRTSKPRTPPGGDGWRPHQSQTEEPTTMTSRTITGGEVIV